MRRVNLAALVLAASCGGVAQMALDAGDDVGPDGRTADAAGPGETVTTLTCVVHTKTSTRISDNYRTEYDRHFAVVDMAIGESFWIERCDLMQLPAPEACSPGYTCQTSGTPYPTGARCDRSEYGLFIGGRLVVDCGYELRSYDASGTLSSRNQYVWASVRLHKP